MEEWKMLWEKDLVCPWGKVGLSHRPCLLSRGYTVGKPDFYVQPFRELYLLATGLFPAKAEEEACGLPSHYKPIQRMGISDRETDRSRSPCWGTGSSSISITVLRSEGKAMRREVRVVSHRERRWEQGAGRHHTKPSQPRDHYKRKQKPGGGGGGARL